MSIYSNTPEITGGPVSTVGVLAYRKSLEDYKTECMYVNTNYETIDTLTRLYSGRLLTIFDINLGLLVCLDEIQKMKLYCHEATSNH